MNFNPYYYPMQQSQPQNNGLVSVRGVNEAMNYPVALGSSVTFKDETAPYIYTKTMGFSQLDRPTFEVFKLVKEDMAETPVRNLEEEIDLLRQEIEMIKAQIEEGTDG